MFMPRVIHGGASHSGCGMLLTAICIAALVKAHFNPLCDDLINITNQNHNNPSHSISNTATPSSWTSHSTTQRGSRTTIPGGLRPGTQTSSNANCVSRVSIRCRGSPACLWSFSWRGRVGCGGRLVLGALCALRAGTNEPSGGCRFGSLSIVLGVNPVV